MSTGEGIGFAGGVVAASWIVSMGDPLWAAGFMVWTVLALFVMRGR